MDRARAQSFASCRRLGVRGMVGASLLAVLPPLAHSAPLARTTPSTTQSAAPMMADGVLVTDPHAAPEPAPRSIDPALRQTSRFIANSNVVGTAHDSEPKADPAQEFAYLLELGRQQRAQKNMALARRNFVALLEGPAPDALKRGALLELATLAEEAGELSKAQQLYAQYLRRWPQDSSVPEVYLRQGLLFRQMGAPTLALSKFYAVMTSALTLKTGSVDYYKKLVLHAQAEIADTYYLQGRYADAVEFFRRLLKLEAADLNRQTVQAKLIRSLAALRQIEPTLAEAQAFLGRYPQAEEEPEIRFLLAQAYKQSGRKADALKQVLLLLEAQHAGAAENRGGWTYWQRRAGNEIGNQLYEEGDYLNALLVYSALSNLDTSLGWQLPVWYQMGLIYERLQQPHQARETYGRILAREKELASGTSPSLQTVVDMARWRIEMLDWQTQSERPAQAQARTATAHAPQP